MASLKHHIFCEVNYAMVGLSTCKRTPPSLKHFSLGWFIYTSTDFHFLQINKCYSKDISRNCPFLYRMVLCEKCLYSKLFWPVFYSVSLRIQSECGKIRTRKTPKTDTFHKVWFFNFSSDSTPSQMIDNVLNMGQSIQEWTKWNLRRIAFKNFEVICSA